MIYAKYDKEKKALELRKLSAETELAEQQVIEKRLENIERQRLLQLSSLDSCSDPLSKAAENLEILPSKATIIDLTNIINSQKKE